MDLLAAKLTRHGVIKSTDHIQKDGDMSILP